MNCEENITCKIKRTVRQQRVYAILLSLRRLRKYTATLATDGRMTRER